MVGSPNLVFAVKGNGICTTPAFPAHTIDTSSACINGICVGKITEYPTVYKCWFLEWDAEFCDDDAQWYTATETPAKTVENESWGRWFACAGAKGACVACLIAAVAAGYIGGPTTIGAKAIIRAYAKAIAGVGGTSVACYYICGMVSNSDECCWVDCEPDEDHKTTFNYMKGC